MSFAQRYSTGFISSGVSLTQEIIQTSVSGNGVTSITVPSGEYWRIVYVTSVCTTTATVGSRYFVLEAIDGSSALVAGYPCRALPTASGTFYLLWLWCKTFTSAFKNNRILTAFPTDLWLSPGWQLQVADTSGIDISNDAQTLHIQYQRVVL